MLFHLFIFSHMNWSIHSYSVGKLTIRMIHVHTVIQCHSVKHARISIHSYSAGELTIIMRLAHCHTMSLIGKHAKICMKLGHIPSM